MGRRVHVTRIVAGVVAIGLAVACGGDGDEGSDAAAGTTIAADGARRVEHDFSGPRVAIVGADSRVLAESAPSDDRYVLQRRYPDETAELFAHTTGHFAFQLGSTGVERGYDGYLAGEDGVVGDVILSLRHDVQQVARDQLGDREGAVVALDPRNGEVLALWSFPTYDPNDLASHDMDAALAISERLDVDVDAPMRSRVFQERTLSGSTFMVVTAAAGVEQCGVTIDDPAYPLSASYEAAGRGTPVGNFGGSSCGGTLFTILQMSCNTAFAEMGVETGGDPVFEMAQAFGFDRDILFDLPGAVQSSFPEAAVGDDSLVDQAVIGHNAVRATPLQMALVAATVANDGVIVTPHVMRDVLDDRGDVVAKCDEAELAEPISTETARILREGMVSVVTHGTAARLADELDGFVVGGKTGTAQIAVDESHAWVIGFAGPDGETPHVAIAVIVDAVEGASEQSAGLVAAPIASAVMAQAMIASTPGEE